MDEETYIEKKIKCPSCKNNIEFAIEMKNIDIVNMKISAKCSSCGAEIILTPSSIIGKVEEKHENKLFDDVDVETSSEYEEIEIPSDINDFFEDVEENQPSEKSEVEENRKTREYINDIFS